METISNSTEFYKIVIKNSNPEKIHIQGLTFDQIIEFKSNNGSSIGREKLPYKVIEMSQLEIDVWNKKSIDERKQQFFSTLSPAQKNDLEIGKKTIGYNKQLGFHLIINKQFKENEVENGQHFSNSELETKRKNEVRTIVKASIKNNKKELFSLMNEKYPNYNISEEEFFEVIESISKI